MGEGAEEKSEGGRGGWEGSGHGGVHRRESHPSPGQRPRAPIRVPGYPADASLLAVPDPISPFILSYPPFSPAASATAGQSGLFLNPRRCPHRARVPGHHPVSLGFRLLSPAPARASVPAAPASALPNLPRPMTLPLTPSVIWAGSIVLPAVSAAEAPPYPVHLLSSPPSAIFSFLPFPPFQPPHPTLQSTQKGPSPVRIPYPPSLSPFQSIST